MFAGTFFGYISKRKCVDSHRYVAQRYFGHIREAGSRVVAMEDHCSYICHKVPWQDEILILYPRQLSGHICCRSLGTISTPQIFLSNTSSSSGKLSTQGVVSTQPSINIFSPTPVPNLSSFDPLEGLVHSTDGWLWTWKPIFISQKERDLTGLFYQSTKRKPREKVLEFNVL